MVQRGGLGMSQAGPEKDSIAGTQRFLSQRFCRSGSRELVFSGGGTQSVLAGEPPLIGVGLLWPAAPLPEEAGADLSSS